MKILFICTHNRCRSILAEALTRHISEGRIDARSAGSQPAGVVFPGTLKYLESQNISTEGLVSQSWDDHESFAPDVVITDINMPNLDGFGVIEELRGDGINSKVPILVLTTESAPEMKARARDAGATGWITKPFDDQSLIFALKRVTGAVA